MRRVLILVVLLLLIGGGVWFFLKKEKQQPINSESPASFLSFLTPNNTKNTIDTPTSPGGSILQPISKQDDAFGRLQQVTNVPVAGLTAYTYTSIVTKPAADPKQKPTKETVKEYILRYVSRNNGYIYEIKDQGAPVQISNIFIPNIYEAFFADTGKTAVLRFLRDDNQTIATYAVPIPDPNPDNTRTQKEGIFLTDNIANISVSPDGKNVAQLLQSTGSSSVITTDTKNLLKKELISTPYKSWIVSWPEKNIYLQTKALSDAQGFLYRIDTVNKRLQKVLGGNFGLTTSVSPLGTYVLYSESNTNSFTTKIFNTKTGSVTQLSALILPEKCVWLKNEDLICAGNEAVPGAQYPESWYAGITSFSDKLYKVYSSGGIISVLDDGTDLTYDATNLTINEEEGLLYFVDKRTGYLWKYLL